MHNGNRKNKCNFSNSSKMIILTGIDFHSPNRGIDALFIGTINCILNKYPNAQIASFGGTSGKWVHNEVLEINNKSINIEFFGERMLKQILTFFISCFFYKCPNFIRKWLYLKHYSIKKFINSHCVIDLSYGDSFSELYGFRWFLMNSLNKITAFNLNRPVIMFPQTMGPFFTTRARIIATYIFKKTKKIYLREKISNYIINGLIKDKSKIIISTDMAFLMKAKQIDNKLWKKKLFLDGPLVGINISGLLFNNTKRQQLIGREFDYVKAMNEIILFFVKEKGCCVYLVPHVYSTPPSQYDDLRACHDVYSQLPPQIQKNVGIIEKDFTAPELKWIIGQFVFFVGGRMHSCIDAMSMKVPTVAIAYSHKFKGIMESIRVGNFVCDLKNLNEEEIVQKIIPVFKEKDKIKKNLEVMIPNAEKLALKCNEYI